MQLHLLQIHSTSAELNVVKILASNNSSGGFNKPCLEINISFNIWEVDMICDQLNWFNLNALEKERVSLTFKTNSCKLKL